MLELSQDLHPRVNGRTHSILKDREITTVPDFLRADSNKLKQFLNIDLMELTSMKMEFWKLSGILPINGCEHHFILTEQETCIPTGIKSLDETLNGGLLPGNLIDSCGFSSTGKTQLHTTIAINWAINQNYETFVIDTKGDFSGDRINRILLSQKRSDPDFRKRVMRCNKVEKCNSASDLIILIRNLIIQRSTFPKFKFLVIDSLPSLWFQFHGTKKSLGCQNLAILADLLRKLAVEKSVVLMTVNIETRSIITCGAGNVANDMDSQDNDVTNRALPSMHSDLTTPALGKHWRTMCALRLQIERPCGAINSENGTTKCSNERTVRILKSNQFPLDKCCTVYITNSGII